MIAGLKKNSLFLDELGGGVGDLVGDGLGHLLHPLGQLRQASSSHNQSSLVLVSDCETSAATL